MTTKQSPKLYLSHARTVLATGATLSRVLVAWEANGRRLALCDAASTVHLVDAAGERTDKFPTKPCEAGRPHSVSGLAWAPDNSGRIAVAQTDGIVCIYALGGVSKNISGRCIVAPAATALIWPAISPTEPLVGDGFGRLCLCRASSGRAATVLGGSGGAHSARIVSMASSGSALAVGAADGSVRAYALDANALARLVVAAAGSGEEASAAAAAAKQTAIITHGIAPNALAWAGHGALLAGGADGRLRLYDATSGASIAEIDWGMNSSEDKALPQALLCAATSQTGDVVAVGSWDRIFLLTDALGGNGGGFGGSRGSNQSLNLRLAGGTAVPGLSGVASLSWSHDGSALAVGSLRGAVDLFDVYAGCTRAVGGTAAVLADSRGNATVVVSRSRHHRLSLRSHDGSRLLALRLHVHGRFVSAVTATGSLLLADVESGHSSEIKSHAGPDHAAAAAITLTSASAAAAARRCNFEHAPLAWVHRNGELIMVELGNVAPLASLPSMSSNSDTVDASQRECGSGDGRRCWYVAYTPAYGQAAVAEVRTGVIGGTRVLAQLEHDTPVSWLALAPPPVSRLLLRDASQLLLLCDFGRASKHPTAGSPAAPIIALCAVPLLAACAFAQWLPGGAGAVAAQSSWNNGQHAPPIRVWYSTAPAALASEAAGCVVDTGGSCADAAEVNVEGHVAILLQPAAAVVPVRSGAMEEAVLLHTSLLAASAAIERGELTLAATGLDAAAVTVPPPEPAGLRAIWAAVGATTSDVDLAMRAATETGNSSRARWLRRRMDDAAAAGMKANAAATAAIAELRGDIDGAATLLLAQGDFGRRTVARMHATAGDWDAALALEGATDSKSQAAARAAAVTEMLAAGDDARAASVYETTGDGASAGAALIRAGLPARAAALAAVQPHALPQPALAQVFSQLLAAGLPDRAASVAELLDANTSEPAARALTCLAHGGAWQAALLLARRVAPARVVPLELAAGRSLRQGSRLQAAAPAKAIAHLIEARAFAEAAAAAAEAGHYARAGDIAADALRGADPEALAAQFHRLATAARAANAHAEAEALLHRASNAVLDGDAGRLERATMQLPSPKSLKSPMYAPASTHAPKTPSPAPRLSPATADLPASPPTVKNTCAATAAQECTDSHEATGLIAQLTALMDAGRSKEALAALAERAIPTQLVASALPLYRRLARAALCGDAGVGAAEALRGPLYEAAAAAHAGGSVVVAATADAFDSLLMPLHYAALRQKAEAVAIAAEEAAGCNTGNHGGDTGVTASDARALAARLAISSLRFVGGPLLPADVAFYEAGTACRRAGWLDAATVFLNRYVDICEVIDEALDRALLSPAPPRPPAVKGLTNVDFIGTGVPPPADWEPQSVQHHIQLASAREEARHWLLERARGRDGSSGVTGAFAGATRSRTSTALPRRPCFSCGEPVFEAALGCPICHAAFPACVASGYPIPASQAVACTSCGSSAIRAYWATALLCAGACPWCRTSAAEAVPKL